MKLTKIPDPFRKREKERLDALTAQVAELAQVSESLIEYQGLTVRDMGGVVYEIVKQTEQPRGDYLNPIPFVPGMEVSIGLWYYDTDSELPAECVQGGIAETFGEPWLDVVV